ncbi:ESX-1 secretion-associated protein [Mycolicibacterium sp.]|uniref:ESX-1 secretion-associated protein n=1 Tax=Mycolicibacterium sp. TaxID=2320850 RepID=UPI001A1C4BDA|nr:ESX-1 secretion-associated protein [Mycolicibacterium sp.]MBJ7341933.1 ESX-1 secretion-associated protein [Mycolicibacterium sp.]
MTAQSDNLKVLTAFLDDIAAKQGTAAGILKVAGETVNDLTDSVWGTHGVVCAPSNLAVSALERARDAAAAKLWHMSHDLSERLGESSANYNNADWLAGRDIDACEM